MITSAFCPGLPQLSPMLSKERGHDAIGFCVIIKFGNTTSRIVVGHVCYYLVDLIVHPRIS